MSDERGPEPEAPGTTRAGRIAVWCAATLLAAAVAAAVFTVAALFAAVTAPSAVALLGAALLRPLTGRLTSRGLPRGLASGVTCVALVAVAGAAGWSLAVAIGSSAGQISSALRAAAAKLSHQGGAAGGVAADAASGLAQGGRELASGLASGVLSGVSLSVQLLAGGVLALALTFFFLRDAHRIPDTLRRWTPEPRREVVVRTARESFAAVSVFMRGTTVVAAIDAVLITVGLVALRVPGALGLGALVFLGAYVPYVGAAVSSLVAVLVAFADRGLVVALWTILVVASVQILEGNLVRPYVQSRAVALHPAVVMVAVTAGASVGGILGTLLAVPAVAVLTAIGRQLRAS